jgi:formate dehydrogenase iron-sulfur subunit
MDQADIAYVLDGALKDLDWMKAKRALTFQRCVIDPLSSSITEVHGGLVVVACNLRHDANRVVGGHETGLRGAAGAGFPTGLKWNTRFFGREASEIHRLQR